MTRDLPPQPSGPEAEHGEQVHHLLALNASGKPWPPDVSRQASEDAFLCWTLLDEMLNDMGYGSSSKCRKVNIEKRLYSKNGLWSGKPDLILELDPGKTCLVVDYKTGKTEVTNARNNNQLQALAVLAWNQYGYTQVRTAIISPHNQEKCSVADYGIEALKKAESWIDFIVKSAMADDAPLHTGDKQCRYCPAKAICPELAKYAMEPVRKAALETTGNENLPDKATASRAAQSLSLERVGELWRARKAYEWFFDALDERVKGLSDAELEVIGLKRVPGRVIRKVNDLNGLYRLLKDKAGMTSIDFVKLCSVSLPKIEQWLAENGGLSHAKARQFLQAEAAELITEERGSDQIVENTVTAEAKS